MAINLWKVGGKPTSYNPLPSGVEAVIDLNIGTYNVSFYASSKKSSKMWVQAGDGSIYLTQFPITPTPKKIEVTITYPKATMLYLLRVDNIIDDDIVISNINVVQQPLPKNTINGIDGFNSGKWTIHPNARVIDDNTLELNATGGIQETGLEIPCLPNTTYTVKFEHNGQYAINSENSSKNFINIATVNWITHSNGFTFTTTSDCRYLFIYFRALNDAVGKFTFSKPILNLGTTPAPYSKKTGERMVMPNVGKNLFDVKRYVDSMPTFYKKSGETGFEIIIGSGGFTSHPILTLKGGKSYTFSVGSLIGTSTCTIELKRADVTVVFNPTLSSGGSVVFTPTQDETVYCKVYSATTGAIIDKFQIEEGNVATPFKPYEMQLNPKPKHPLVQAKTGLAFNGVTDYLQLPSMTMDSIEIDCLIDTRAVQYEFIMDARNGFLNAFSLITNGIVDGTSVLTTTGYKKGTRTQVRVQSSTPFTDNINIFSDYVGAFPMKGTLYKVTCYLAGNVVASYDFTNPSNIVGNTIVQNAKNLIPSFEDARWSLHANTQVLGKDVLRLNASSVSQQASTVIVPCKPNQKYNGYIGYTNTGNGYVWYDYYDINMNYITGYAFGIQSTSPSNASYIKIVLVNSSSGSFDFIKPQIYQLDGTQGTINGAPTLQRKVSRRTQYAKR